MNSIKWFFSSLLLAGQSEQHKNDVPQQEVDITFILFSGGFDSTFRLVQLSQLPVKIQPIYLLFLPSKNNEGRHSMDYEMKAIHQIADKLRNDPRTKATILPIKIVKSSELKYEQRKPFHKTVSEISKEVKNFGYPGIAPQNGWLASLCKMLNLSNVELVVTSDDKLADVLGTYCGFTKKSDKLTGNYYIIAEPRYDSPELAKKIYFVWKYFKFSTIHISKLEMESLYKKWGYEDIMKMTWTCYRPIDGKACGECAVCRNQIEAGLKFQFDKTALRRYDEYMEKRRKSIVRKIHSLAN